MPGTHRQRTAVLAAGLLIVLALGLPWTMDTMEHVPGWMTAGTCLMDSDGMMTCTGGFVSPGYYVGSGAASGANTVARVFLVGALALVVLAWRQGQRAWFVVAGVGVGLSILLVGMSVQGGQVAAAGAAALLLYAGLSGGAVRARSTA
ncbi:hypothetical protein FNH13_10695 [Ornithinimicrobium ciconiae]|uniref:Uncharacterized protein n=1 Tax=Ornithinimicrobium ciconiae TaxID=2594265 RepID=A0A516GB60_9MICO|nr:hypothetical protein [Ornithinimicrobium ciconiae]QDO88732.1 hypothetical protein FNH13_10695 [Ornithinimicrobium ciconiae]